MSTDTTTKKPELKPLEVGVGAGAAVITAFASSYLGTAGTITGAAVASVVGTVSTSVLRASAAGSAERLRETTARLRETRTGSMPQPTDVRPVESGSDPEGPEGTPLVGAPDPGPRGGRRPGRRQLVLLGLGTVIAFAVALVLITGIESAAGKPLAGLVGKQTGGGTTIGRSLGTDSGSSPKTTPSPTPSATTGTTGEPTGSATPDPTAEPGAAEPTPEPSATTGVPSVTAPAPTAPTAPPTATTNPLTSKSPQSTP